jgi:selenophosphate synthase
VDWSGARAEDRALALDPQTSGGLLVAVPSDRLSDYLSAVPGSVEIGKAEAAGNRPIILG